MAWGADFVPVFFFWDVNKDKLGGVECLSDDRNFSVWP